MRENVIRKMQLSAKRRFNQLFIMNTKSGKVYWRVICNGRNGPVSLELT